MGKGTDKYIVGAVERFDQQNEMFSRSSWDPIAEGWSHILWGSVAPLEKEGYSLRDRALQNAAWYVQNGFAGRRSGLGSRAIYAWENIPEASYSKIPPEFKLDVSDPETMSHQIKKVAKFLGASLVGICQLDESWVYSHSYHRLSEEHQPLEIPERWKYAIAIAIEMDYQMIRMSPTCIASAAVGLGYSLMAFVAGSVAQFIRDLGYIAIPCGNDTALSIPIAIDAGLGELGRNGLLFTPEFGPRVRLCKVFTDLPLVPDEPREFGVLEFCEKCDKCARNCPGRAIPYSGRTDKPHNISNNSGVLKWPVDAEKCLGFWASMPGSSCANCIRVCPFNKPTGALHSAARWTVKNTPWLDPFLLRMDDAFGYGKQAKAKEYWQEVDL